jgi:hypothetical protein
MFTFRTSITLAVMMFVVALAGLLIAIQVRSLRAATHEAAAAFMDSASTKALGRLKGELNAVFPAGHDRQAQSGWQVRRGLALHQSDQAFGLEPVYSRERKTHRRQDLPLGVRRLRRADIQGMVTSKITRASARAG